MDREELQKLKFNIFKYFEKIFGYDEANDAVKLIEDLEQEIFILALKNYNLLRELAKAQMDKPIILFQIVRS